MRRIEIREPFSGASQSEIERLYMLDDAFNEATFRALGFAREVTRRDATGDTLARELTLTPLHALPGPFAALLPAGLLRITEQIEYDFTTHTGRWRTIPSALSHQFRAEGTLAIEASEGGAVFVLEGEADASIPLLGGRAEKHAVSTAARQHEALARAIRQRLAAGGATSDAAD